MTYTKEVIKKVLEGYEGKAKAAEGAAEGRKLALYSSLPELRAIDGALAETGMRLVRAALAGGDIEGEIGRIKAENLALQARRADILRASGYSADYTEPVYQCAPCRDTGYVGADMCACLKRELSKAGLEASGLGGGLGGCTFDNFDLSYYSAEKGDNAVCPRDNAAKVLSICKDYAENFGARASGGLFFVAPTGLGKTHLALSTARRVMERGFEVIYGDAQSILYSFERDRFGNDDDSEAEEAIRRYMDCDLLVMDDLGNEYTGPMAARSLFKLVNHRLMAGRGTIICTNLSLAEMQRRYDEAILSRLVGEYTLLRLVGEDIRILKKKL